MYKIGDWVLAMDLRGEKMITRQILGRRYNSAVYDTEGTGIVADYPHGPVGIETKKYLPFAIIRKAQLKSGPNENR